MFCFRHGIIFLKTYVKVDRKDDFMKFITVQDASSKQTKDVNGNIKVEMASYNEIRVPVNKSLGFSPMWVIPVTTFKETLVNLLMCAPNYPRFLCVFDSDNYVKIDKLQHYRNIMNDVYPF